MPDKRYYYGFNRWPFFPFKPSKQINKYGLWRKAAKAKGLSQEARKRLEWIIYYHTSASRNARLTCRHFGTPPKTFYKWFDRFNETNLGSLEDESRAPKRMAGTPYTAHIVSL